MSVWLWHLGFFLGVMCGFANGKMQKWQGACQVHHGPLGNPAASSLQPCQPPRGACSPFLEKLRLKTEFVHSKINYFLLFQIGVPILLQGNFFTADTVVMFSRSPGSRKLYEYFSVSFFFIYLKAPFSQRVKNFAHCESFSCVDSSLETSNCHRFIL